MCACLMRRAASLDTYTFEFELTFIELRNDDLRCLFANTLRYSRPVTVEILITHNLILHILNNALN